MHRKPNYQLFDSHHVLQYPFLKLLCTKEIPGISDEYVLATFFCSSIILLEHAHQLKLNDLVILKHNITKRKVREESRLRLFMLLCLLLYLV